MNHIVFTFPGQGGYSFPVIRDLYVNFPFFKSLFLQADAITLAKLGYHFLPIVQAESKQAHDAYLAKHPDLDQVGIYLINLLIAKLHLQSGIKPELLLGHSFGEIAALATAGAFTDEEGIQIVCDRIVSLQHNSGVGRMAAISCDAHTALQLLQDCALNIYIAVQNHSKQTIIAGSFEDLSALKRLAASKAISITFIESKYPFHSPFLHSSVQPFYEKLKLYKFKEALYPVYLGTEHKLYDLQVNLAETLSKGFTTPLHFSKIIEILTHCGFQSFIECGSGALISNIVRKNLPRTAQYGLFTTLVKGRCLAEGIAELYGKVGVAPDAVHANIPEPTAYPEEENVSEVPVAIIAMGSVLPGSVGVEQFWKNISEGIDSIVDLGEFIPALREDILGGTHKEPVVDKTYTLLRGSVRDVPWQETLHGKYYNKQEFEKSNLAEKMLAHTIAECKEAISYYDAVQSSRVKCFLGSTAEGFAGLSVTAYLEVLEQEMKNIDPSLDAGQLSALTDKVTGGVPRSKDRSQFDLCDRIIKRMLHENVETLLIDTACSSSAYATHLAASALIDKECDLALAGGIYVPDPSCFATFAQFRGLTATNSTPFDAQADGVVFADGATLIAMKRLDDAIDAGDNILCVLRGVGLSSDGKSVAINVPRTPGQKLAMERGLQKSGLSVDTLQYIEAHATATSVGDAIEANSISEITATRDKSLPPVELGGIKALIGHTGWTASTASLLKMIKAFEENTIPKQTKFSIPNKRIKPEASGIHISIENRPWPVNVDHLPKRAGINSFGFGGTNTHTIIESFEAAYHTKLLEGIKPQGTSDAKLVIVGTGFLYPSGHSLSQELPGDVSQFDRFKLVLPEGKVLLPDVKEAMDPSQFLSTLAAEKVLNTIEGKWQQLRDSIGVVVGMESGTERSAWTRERLLSDQVKRRALTDTPYQHSVTMLQAIDNLKEKRPASTPYTLPGLLPSITASRVSFLFNLQGPNMIVDSGKNSLMQAVATAARLLRSGDSALMIAGGINCYSETGRADGEAACLVGLTTAAIAEQYGMDVICEIRIEGLADEGKEENNYRSAATDYKGATWGPELQQAIATSSQTGDAVVVTKNAKHAFSLSFQNSGVRAEVELN